MGRHRDTAEDADDAWTESRGDRRPDEMFGGYTITDRRKDGYKGRWRYLLLRPDRYSRTLFKRRADAASFATRADVVGIPGALALMEACGNRPGVDFKREPSK